MLFLLGFLLCSLPRSSHIFLIPGDYIREKLGLEKIGPSNKWQGEPGAPSLGGEITDDAIGQLMQRRERQQRLSESWKLLAQVDMELVIAAVAERELFPSPTAESSAGQRAQEEIRQSEEEAKRALQQLRDALGDAKRATMLEKALEQLWNRSSVLRLSERDAREEAAEAAGRGAGRSPAPPPAGARSGHRMEEELGRLGVQMRGMDVEGLIEALVRCEGELQRQETTGRALEHDVTRLNGDLAQVGLREEGRRGWQVGGGETCGRGRRESGMGGREVREGGEVGIG